MTSLATAKSRSEKAGLMLRCTTLITHFPLR